MDPLDPAPRELLGQLLHPELHQFFLRDQAHHQLGAQLAQAVHVF